MAQVTLDSQEYAQSEFENYIKQQAQLIAPDFTDIKIKVAIAQLSQNTKIAKYDVPTGYVNATQMCKACGKQWGHYACLDSTKAYWEGLSTEIGIPISALVISIKGGNEKQVQGTWTHPEIAIDLAQWASVEFRIWANRTLRQVMSIEPIQQPKTQIQMLAALAQQMADTEQHLLSQSNRIAAVEAEQQRYQTPCGHYYTVMGFANLHKINVTASDAATKGRAASRICKAQDIQIEQIFDPRFGKVGLYPESVLVQVFK